MHYLKHKAFSELSSYDTGGFALTLVLFLLLLLTSSLCILHRVVSLELQEQALLKAGYRDQKNAHNTAMTHLLATEGIRLPIQSHDPQAQAEVIQLFKENIPLALLRAVSTSKLSRSEKSFILSFHGNPLKQVPRPDWTHIEFKTRFFDDSCQRWTPFSLAKSAYSDVFSSSTCTALSENIDRSMLIAGNLHLSKELQIDGRLPKNTTLAIRGSLQLKQSLFLNKMEDTSIEIIAAGNIELSKIQASIIRSTSLLIHSTWGSVNIRELGSEISLCDTSSISAGLHLRIEAAQGIVIGSGNSKDSRVLGCPVSKNNPDWPRYKILGEFSE